MRIKNVVRSLLLAMIGLLAVSCASAPASPPLYAVYREGNPSRTNAMVVLARPKATVGSLAIMSLFIDGQKVASIGNGQSVEVQVTPGFHKLVVDGVGGLLERDVRFFRGSVLYVDLIPVISLNTSPEQYYRVADTPPSPPTPSPAPSGSDPAQ